VKRKRERENSQPTMTAWFVAREVVVVDADHDADEEHEEIGAVAFSN